MKVTRIIVWHCEDRSVKAHGDRKRLDEDSREQRQAGVLAAAALFALEHNVARLTDDHRLARRLADGLAGISGLNVEPPQTNIVFVDVVGPAKSRAAELIPYLKSRGVLVTGLYRLRFVTHLDVNEAGIDQAVQAIQDFFKC